MNTIHRTAKLFDPNKMSDNSSNETDLSCFDIYADHRYTALAVLSVVLSILSCIFLLAAIALIVLFKKYVYFSQKLILYLCIASLLFSFSTAINVTPPDAHTNPVSKAYCIVMGFIDQLFLWWQIDCVAIIMIDVFIRVVFERNTRKYKIPYIIGIVVPPLVISWIPFIGLSYGPAGVFCWIRDREYETCEVFTLGAYFRFFIYYIPLYLLMIGLAMLLVITLCIARRKKKQWIAGNLGKEAIELQKKIISETRPLIWYPVFLMMICISPLILRIYGIFKTDGTFFFILSYLLVMVYRLIGVIIALIFVFDPETRKKLNRVEIQAAIQRWKGREKNAVVAYEAEIGRSDSFSGKNAIKIEKDK